MTRTASLLSIAAALFIPLSALHVHVGDALAVDTADSLALVDLYNSTNGPNWTNSTHWLSSSRVNVWYGVTVYNKRVTRISMVSNNMEGPLPASIGDLDQLESLLFNYNKINGSIPETIGRLTRLKTLQAEWNKLSGSVPEEIGGCRVLEMILLAGNELTGPIPPETGDLHNLKYLRLRGNALDGPLPSELFDLSGLLELDLGENLIDGTIPPEIGNLTELTHLELNSNSFRGSIPPEIGKLSNLRLLWLNDNGLGGTLPAEIGQIDQLEILAMEYNYLSGPIPTEIGGLGMLQSLDLAHNKLTGQIPPAVGNLANVSLLDLSNNRLEGAVPEEITNMTFLQYLWVNDNLLEDMPDLSGMPALIDVRMENNRFTFEDIEPHVLQLTDFITYAPQDSVGREIDTTVALDSSFTFSVDVGGQFNRYRWLKDGKYISGAWNDTLVIDSVDIEDGGLYACEIMNQRCPRLTLFSRPIIMNGDLIFPFSITPDPHDLWPHEVLRPGMEVAFSGSLAVRLLSADEGYIHVDLVNEHKEVFARSVIEGVTWGMDCLEGTFDSLKVSIPVDPDSMDTLFVRGSLFAVNKPDPVSSFSVIYRVFIHDWTFLVYLDGDNDLELASIFDFYEMIDARPDDSVAVVLQWDRHPEDDMELGYVSGTFSDDDEDWWQTKRIFIDKDYLLEEDVGELNMGDPNTLADFVKWGMETFPAHHTALVLWDHGGGWRAKSLPFRYMGKAVSGLHFPSFPPGAKEEGGPYKDVIVDETDNDVLYSAEIRLALSRLPKLDILAFDACLMSMVENAYQYRDGATFMVSSEATEPYDGWPYESILDTVQKSSNMTPAEVSGMIVQEYGASYPPDWDFITQTSVDMGKMDDVKEAVDALAGLLIEQRPWTSVERAAREAWGTYHRPHRDLYHFAQLLQSYCGVTDIRTACDSLMQAISSAVVHNYHSPGDQNANGLAIFFPMVQSQYDASYDWGNNIELSDDTRWDEFLRLFVSRGFSSPDTYERNDTLSQAYGPLLPQTRYVSYISFSEDKDFFYVTTGQQTDLSLTLSSPNNVNYDLAVYDFAGTLLGSSLLEGDIDSLFLEDLQAGTYYIEVVSSGNFSVAPYSLTLDYSGAGTGQLPIFFDDSIPDSSLFSANMEDVIGSRLHAPDYPMMLDEISFYIEDLDGAGTGGDGSFYVYLADYFGTIIEPFQVTPGRSHARGTSQDIGWFSIDLSGYGIRLQSDFFLGVGYDGQNTPALGMDPEDNGATYQWDSASKGWRSLSATAFVRAMVSYLETPERVSISIDSGIEGSQEETVTVPLRLEGVLSPGADSLEIDITFDPHVLRFSSLITDGTLTAGWRFDRMATSIAGRVETALHGDTPLTGPGLLLDMQCILLSTTSLGDTIEISIEKVLLDNGTYAVESRSGFIVVVSATGVEDPEAGMITAAFALGQNYPNPFNSSTSIQYAVGSGQLPHHVTLKVFNILGQEVATLVSDIQEPGTYAVTWDGRDRSGSEVPSGIYLCKIEANDFRDVMSMILLR